MSSFKLPAPEQVGGIYRALRERPHVPLGQASNFLYLTAAVYEPLWRGRSLSILTGGDFSTERELDLMLSQVSPAPGATVLDAACSAGLYARTLLQREASLNVHAVDYSLPFLQRAKAYAQRDGVKPILVHADVSALPHRDEVFDAVVCGGSLNEFLDLPDVLSELARVLKPGGRMWQMYLTKADSLPGKLVQGLIRACGIRFIDPERLEAEAAKVGLGLSRAQYRGRVGLALFTKQTA